MTFRQLIKGSLFRFEDLKNAKNTSFWKVIVYLLGLSLILAIPSVYQALQVMDQIKTDSLKIVEKIPDFQIEDGEIKTTKPEKGFIYQTNSIILTFDPENKRTQEDIEKDLVGNYFSVGLLKKQAIVVLPDYGGVSSALFGDNVLKFSYAQEPLSVMTGDTLRSELKDLKIPIWTPLVMLAAGIYPSFINLFVTLIFAGFAGMIVAKLRLRRVKFFDCFKTIIFCATIPTILATIVLLFQPSFDSSILITFVSLFIFFRVINYFPKIELPTN
ncbi:DUF1189 domain-containing protein [Enterococcus xiangfangensis]|uniref:DUF1189 domain-containing protein n=1 Tax=Enterococcus xiangfangensis TaxID=1296537 RepID=UPI0010F57547|nr:DUF1189 domain-containing protein [Enterococcus xiangfangensis]MBM7710536.1 maltodextrin utilization protein YvdJ [Enterococcus xiangfangensis]